MDVQAYGLTRVDLSFGAEGHISVMTAGYETEPGNRGKRARFYYLIFGPSTATEHGWRYDGNDLSGPVVHEIDINRPPDVMGAARSLAAFLVASAEAVRATDSGRYSDNGDIFPEHVARFAQCHENELGLFSIDPEEL